MRRAASSRRAPASVPIPLARSGTNRHWLIRAKSNLCPTTYLFEPTNAGNLRPFAVRNAGASGFTVNHAGGPGFYGTVSIPASRPTVTGSRGGNAALADLLAKLASFGLITDGTTS